MAGHATHVRNEFRRWRKIFNSDVTVDEGDEKAEMVDPDYTEKTTRRRPPTSSEEEENASAVADGRNLLVSAYRDLPATRRASSPSMPVDASRRLAPAFWVCLCRGDFSRGHLCYAHIVSPGASSNTTIMRWKITPERLFHR
jgi:hypothetical protein